MSDPNSRSDTTIVPTPDEFASSVARSVHSFWRGEEGDGVPVEEQPARDRGIQGLSLFLDALGFDLSDEHLRDTPRRVYDMFRDELLCPPDFAITTFDAVSEGLVVVRDIPFVSVCAHHLLPFIGTAHIGYIPTERMIGLSKLARIVDYHAKTLQVQERMTDQILATLVDLIEPLGAGVLVEADHLCMSVRGIKAVGASTVTASVVGVMMDDGNARAEFYRACGKKE